MKPGFGILIFSGLNQLSFSQPKVWIYLASYKFRPQVVCPENLNNKLLFIVLHKLKTFLFCWIKTIHCRSFSPVYDFYDQTLNSPTFIFAVMRINEVGYIHRLQIVTISFIVPFLYWGHLGFFFIGRLELSIATPPWILFPLLCFLVPEKKGLHSDQRECLAYGELSDWTGGSGGHFCDMVRWKFCHRCLPRWHLWSPV